MPKDFTSFDVAAVTQELAELIANSRVNNIYQVDVKTFLFRLHRPETPPIQLVLEAGRRVNLTNFVTEKPMTPPGFCMALRRYLRNGFLAKVENIAFERIVSFFFKTRGGLMTLVVELFGDGNIILVSETGRIIIALSYRRMRDRNIIRGEQFKQAPSVGKNPLELDEAGLKQELKKHADMEIVRVLARYVSLGGVYAEEVLLRAEVDKSTLSGSLGEKDFINVYECLGQLTDNLKTRTFEPRLVTDLKGEFIDVVPFQLKKYDNPNYMQKPFGSFNEALDEFYTRATVIEKVASNAELERLNREAERLRRVVAEQEQALAEAKARSEVEKHRGDTIYTNMQPLQSLLARFEEAKEAGKGPREVVSQLLAEKAQKVTPSVFFGSFDAKNSTITMILGGLTLDLSLRKSLFENASHYYELGKAAKEKSEGIKGALAESRGRLRELEAKLRETELLTRGERMEALKIERRRVTLKKWFEKFRWFISSDGFLVVAGKDAVTNEVLIKKHTGPRDIVFHADIVGAPFVVVKTEDKSVSKECLHEAAEFAAAFSRGWREGFASVDVYWVDPDQLTKSGPSGASVGHGAFFVRGERNWNRGTVLRLAVGVDERASEIKIIGGPVNSIKAKTDAFVVIVPGDLEGKDLFRQIIYRLLAKVSAERRDSVSKISGELVREFIPFGKARIVKE